MLETRQLNPTLSGGLGLSLWEKLDDATVAELRDLYARSRVGVSPPGAERSGVAAFCAPFDRWSAPCAAIGPPHHTRGDGDFQSQGRARPALGGLGDGSCSGTLTSLHEKPATGAALHAVRTAAPAANFWVDCAPPMQNGPVTCGRNRRLSAPSSITPSRPVGLRPSGPWEIFGESAQPDTGGDACADSRPPRDRRPSPISIRRHHRHRRDGYDSGLECWTRSTRAPPATNRLRPTCRSATWCYGQRFHDAPAHAVRPGRRRLMKRMTMNSTVPHVTPEEAFPIRVGMPILPVLRSEVTVALCRTVRG